MANCGSSPTVEIKNNITNEDAVTSTSPRQSSSVAASTSSAADDEAFSTTIRKCCQCGESVQGKPSKLLACLHTACSPCHIAHMQEGEFACPICFIKSKATDIVENFVAHGLDSNEKPPVRCHEDCPDGATAKFHCVQCEDDLCEKCKDAHQRVKVTKDHQMLPINSNRSLVWSNKCPKHPQEEMTLFCEARTCKRLTCRDCQLSQEHTGHEHSDINKAASNQRASLLTFASNAETKKSALEGHYRTVTEKLAEVERNKEIFKRELRTAAEAVHAVLMQRIKELNDTIERACDQRSQIYLAVKTPLERTIEMTKQAERFATAAASLNDKHAMLRSFQFTLSHLSLINTLHKSCKLDTLQNAEQPMALRVSPQELTQKIVNFGAFICGDPQDQPSTSAGASPAAAAVRPPSTTNGGAATPESPRVNNKTPNTTTVPQQPQSHLRPQQQGQAKQQLQLQQLLQASPCHAAVVQHPTPYACVDQLGVMHQRPQFSPNAAPRALPIRQYVPQNHPASATNTSAVPPNVYVQHQQQQQAIQQQQQQQQAANYYTKSALQYSHQYPQQQLQHQQQRQQYPPQQQQQLRYAAYYPCGMPANFAPNRHTAPNSSMPPNSPSGVSSTTVTPPQGAYQNQAAYAATGDQRNCASMATSYQSTPQLQPPPLYTQQQNRPMAPSSNFHHDLNNTQHRLVVATQSQSPCFIPLTQSLTIVRHPPPYQQQSSNLPTLVPAPIYQQIMQSTPDAPRQNNGFQAATVVAFQGRIESGAAKKIAPPARVQADPNGANSQSTNRERAVSGDAARSNNNYPERSNRTVWNEKRIERLSKVCQPASSSVASVGENGITNGNENDLQRMEMRRIELVPISPTATDAEESSDGSLPTAPESTQLPAPIPTLPPLDQGASSGIIVEDGNRLNGQEPNSAPNVSSTTTEHSSLLVVRNSDSPVIEVQQRPLRLARKSIGNRAIIDSNGDAGNSLLQNPLAVTPPPLLFIAEDVGFGQDAFAINGDTNVVNSHHRSSSIETPPLAEDDADADEDRVTTTDESTEPRTNSSTDDTPRQDSARTWDDYCNVCNNGGTLVCCDGPGCSRVFHHDHHIPQLDGTPKGTWFCTFCIDLDQYKSELDEVPRDDRKNMTEFELRTCQRILLELYTHSESVAFHEPVDAKFSEYFEIVRHPVDFSSIRKRLASRGNDGYKHLLQFVNDLNQVFMNCDTFNTMDRDPELRSAGVAVGQFYLELMNKFLPDLVDCVKLNASSKKRRASTSSSHDSGTSSASNRRRRGRIILHDEDDST